MNIKELFDFGDTFWAFIQFTCAFNFLLLPWFYGFVIGSFQSKDTTHEPKPTSSSRKS